MSADGRFVAFASEASNLVPSDTNATYDVFVHDRQSVTTERVSIASDGTQGNGTSHQVSVSADGRFVAFNSAATNLVPGDTNGAGDVFVHDRQLGTTERVSIASDGTQGNGSSFVYGPAVSADGRFVAFQSSASNLVLGDTNGKPDLFVHDRQTGVTDRVSVSSDGTQGNHGTGNDSTGSHPSISPDGRFVAFASDASNLVPDDLNNKSDVFVHDRQSGSTELVSVTSNGTQWGSHSHHPSLSDDGRYVAFVLKGAQGSPSDVADVFVRDRQSGATEQVSLAPDGTQGNDNSIYPSISADGRYVAFQSLAWNLVAGDTNGKRDAFLRDRGTSL